MNIGDKIENLTFTATNGLTSDLQAWRGKWLILYFYPKDSTPGCTTEGQDFRDAYPKIKAMNADVLGVSRDSLKSHENFKCKQSFPFELISDSDEKLCQAFDVIKMKSMYGKQYQGIERSTFIINPEGKLACEWRKVSVKNHVNDLIQTLSELQAQK